MAEEIEFLKKRSKEFYENAKHLFKQGKYNLSAFNLEQSCQLFLKYYQKKELFFDDLTDAYFTSRYLPREFTKTIVEKMFSEFEAFIKFLGKTLKIQL